MHNSELYYWTRERLAEHRKNHIGPSKHTIYLTIPSGIAYIILYVSDHQIYLQDSDTAYEDLNVCIQMIIKHLREINQRVKRPLHLTYYDKTHRFLNSLIDALPHNLVDVLILKSYHGDRYGRNIKSSDRKQLFQMSHEYARRSNKFNAVGIMIQCVDLTSCRWSPQTHHDQIPKIRNVVEFMMVLSVFSTNSLSLLARELLYVIFSLI